jgi:hypothetical protein
MGTADAVSTKGWGTTCTAYHIGWLGCLVGPIINGDHTLAGVYGRRPRRLNMSLQRVVRKTGCAAVLRGAIR